MPVRSAEIRSTEIRRISQNAVEPTPRNDVRDLQEPVEEALVVSDSLGHRGGLACGDQAIVPEPSELGVGHEFGVVVRRLRDVELGDGHRRDGFQLSRFETVGEREETFLLRFDFRRGPFGQCRERVPVPESSLDPVLHTRGEKDLADVRAVAFVVVAPFGGEVFVVAGHGREGFGRDAFVEFFLADEADDGVAAFDVVVEEVEGLSGGVGFQPERDLAEFDGEGVEIDSVDAGPDYVAEGDAEGARGGLFFSGADDGEFGRDAAGGG